MKKLLSIILSITMLLSMASVAFANETVATTGAKEVEGIIKVGVNAEFPPFEYMENDKLVGFDVDLMNYIAARIGYGVEFVNMDFDKLIPAVVSGEVDCAISAITATDERESVVDFTRPYLAANVTYKDEDSATEQLEMYSIVFKDGVADTKYSSKTPSKYEMLFMLVNDAIEELIDDATVEKLIEKYNLNKADDKNAYVSYEYIVLKSTATDAKEDLEIPAKETQEEVADVVYEGELSSTPLAPPSEWAKDSVIKAQDLGITEKDKPYSYGKPISREEFCELIYNYCANVLEMLSTADGNKFTDTDNPKIKILSAMGIINGKTATEFAPNDALTREEAAVILQRMVNATVPVSVTEMWFEFNDLSNISEWAMDAVQTMCNMNVMNGVGNNNFAPKEVYTTEQAIVTITRVYSAQTAQFRDDIGNEEPIENIIGGADAPTQIVVTDTIKIDDFYVDEAIKLTTEAGECAADKDFIGYYTSSDEMLEQILALGALDYSKPKAVYYMATDREKMAENIVAMLGEEAEGIDIEKLLALNKVNFSTLASMINSSYGADNLAALVILTNAEGYIMPKDFKNDFALYLEYEGDYSALISFSKFGDGVISANMSFIKNGERDNIFSRLYEITQGLGEDSIDVAIVK